LPPATKDPVLAEFAYMMEMILHAASLVNWPGNGFTPFAKVHVNVWRQPAPFQLD
jgi:hypothetical protein